jgi:hypothetical protein
MGPSDLIPYCTGEPNRPGAHATVSFTRAVGRIRSRTSAGARPRHMATLVLIRFSRRLG